jgi:hypothetical protein
MSYLTIHDERGRLTSYGLSCGFIERERVGDVSITLWREHDCYHVRGHNHATGKRLFWDGYKRLDAARQAYSTSIKTVSMGV